MRFLLWHHHTKKDETCIVKTETNFTLKQLFSFKVLKHYLYICSNKKYLHNNKNMTKLNL